MLGDRLRKQPLDGFAKGPCERVISFQIQVNMFVEHFVARDSTGALPGQSVLCVQLINTSVRMSGSDSLDDRVQFRISAKRQGITITSPFEALARLIVIGQYKETTSLTKRQFRKSGIDRGSLRVNASAS